MTNLRDHQESGSYADDLERWIAYRLLEAAPDDFLRLDLRALVLRDFLDVRLAVVPPQGPPRSAPLPDDARDCLVWLREEMAATDGYPWVSFRMFVDDGLDFGSVFNHTLDPCWDAEVPPEVWEADREAFPRPPVPGQPAHGGPVPAAGHPGERRLAGHLRLTLPSHWSAVQLSYRALGGYEEYGALVHTLGGGLEPWMPPEPVIGHLRQHRRETAHPARGAWLSASVELTFPSQARFTWNDTAEPRWLFPPPPQAYADELAAHPRAEAHVPPWFRAAGGG